ncbi:hypothetical protein CPB86DRAFT_723258 [Serendipita vermifera]|nr:hypothetical protein CPB86DRAFT_723258 [Serendipita vermifera]
MPAASKRPRPPRELKQTHISDYFLLYASGRPVSIFHPRHSGRYLPHSLASILDLPNELLLHIHDLICLEEAYFESAKQLQLVCSRFHDVFAPRVFENIRCLGSKGLRRLRNTLQQNPHLADKIKNTQFCTPRLKQMIFTTQLDPFLSRLINLTTISLNRMIVSFKLLAVLGKLEHLTSLTYAVNFPYELLLDQMPFEFEPQPKPEELPKKLRSLTVDFLAPDEEEIAFDIFRRVVEASASTLRFLKLDLHDIRTDLPVGMILQLDLTSLTHIYLYNVDTFWGAFDRFNEQHSSHLKVAEVVLRGWPEKCDEGDNDDEESDDEYPDFLTFRIEELPLLGDLNVKEGETKEITKRGIISFSMKMEKDPAGQYTASEFAMLGGTWGMLRIIGEKHPYLRSLNIWDASANKTVLQELRACAQYLPHLEVLRLNRPSLDGPETHMTTLAGHAVQPPCWTNMCPPEEVHPCCDCFSCTLGVFEEEERRALCEEWVETEWVPYRTQAFALIKLFPKLRLFEWFLVDFIEDYLCFVRPRFVFWEWKVTRRENTTKFTANQNIRCTPYDELFEEDDLEHGWSLTRGFSCDQDDGLAERLREQSRY